MLLVNSHQVVCPLEITFPAARVMPSGRADESEMLPDSLSGAARRTWDFEPPWEGGFGRGRAAEISGRGVSGLSDVVALWVVRGKGCSPCGR